MEGGWRGRTTVERGWVAMGKGVYQLLIGLHRDEIIAAGKLGAQRFPAGFYVYTGSAMNGLDARIARHLRRSKRFHWHIDFLLERSTIIRYAIEESSSRPSGRCFVVSGNMARQAGEAPDCRTACRRECEINAATLAMPGAQVVAEGFGSSDCRCRTHLVYFESEPELPLES